VFLGISTTLYLFSFRKDLQSYNLSVNEITVLEALPFIPWVYKCIFAYYSEKIPLFGSNQKNYLILMNLLSGVLCCVLVERRKNYQELLLVFFFQQTCAVWSDCVLDSLKIVESNQEVKDEKGSNGRFNTRVQISRTCGYWIGNSLGPILWYKLSSQGVYGLLSLSYFLPLVLTFFIQERQIYEKPQKGCMKNVKYIWGGFKHPILGKVLLFVLLIGVFVPSSSTPVFFFLNDVVEITPGQQSILNFIAHAIELLSLLSFDRWIRKWTLKRMYVLFSFLQVFVILFLLLLVVEVPGTSCLHQISATNTTLSPCYYYEYAHLDPFGLALGENVLGESIDELLRLPLVTITTQLCTGQLGGTMFTLIYALQNICNGIFARAFNSQVISMLGIDHYQFKNLPLLIILGASCWLFSSLVAACIIPSITFAEIENDRANKKFASSIKKEFQIPFPHPPPPPHISTAVVQPLNKEDEQKSIDLTSSSNPVAML
jgi:hypothetical protein